MWIALSLVAAALVPQDPAPAALPRVVAMDDALRVELGDGVGVTLARAPLRVTSVRVGGEDFTAHRPDPELWLDGAKTAPRLEDWRIDRDRVVLRVALGQGEGGLTVLETFHATEVDGLPALERRALARRRSRVPGDWTSGSPILTVERLGLLPGGRRIRAVELYGYSTVSDPGTTYELEGLRRDDESTLWTFRAGLHLMNQANNPDHDADHLEVTVLAPPGHRSLDAALVERYVTQPQDRHDLLRATAPPLPPAPERESDPELAASIEQLRHAIGAWSVTTELLDEDGSVAGRTEGTYTFEWVVEDRVVSGTSDQPALGRRAALLFYVSTEPRKIEMVSVGADGKLWVMTGPLGGDVRTSQVYATADGGEAQLRFTRSEVTPDRFVSRMEVTRDGGRTWSPGNRQVFVRK